MATKKTKRKQVEVDTWLKFRKSIAKAMKKNNMIGEEE